MIFAQKNIKTWNVSFSVLFCDTQEIPEQNFNWQKKKFCDTGWNDCLCFLTSISSNILMSHSFLFLFSFIPTTASLLELNFNAFLVHYYIWQKTFIHTTSPAIRSLTKKSCSWLAYWRRRLPQIIFVFILVYTMCDMCEVNLPFMVTVKVK